MEGDSRRTIGGPAAARPATLLRTRLPVLGVPVDFATDDPLLLEAVEAALGPWRLLDYRASLVSRLDRPPRIRLLLGEDEPDHDGPFVVRSPLKQRLELHGPGVRGQADATSLTAVCTVSPTIMRDRYRFDEQVLGTLTLYLVTRCDRQPFHAAAITREGRALLLVGRSGSGKSTLAYAALRSGWTVLSDDAIYVQTGPVRRVWARPARLHLPLDVVDRFTELAARPLVHRENGRTKLSLELTGTWLAALRPLERATLCLLERDAGAADVRSVDADHAISMVVNDLDEGFDVFRDTIGPAVRAVVDERALVVRTGSDPLRTMALLGEMQIP